MKIAVCIKQVPTREWQPRLNDDKTWVREQDVSYEMNEPDAYALEESLRLREKHGGEVVVCSAGPTRVQQVIREALARGADRALHVEDDSLGAADASTAASALAPAMAEQKFDLILTGLQSDDQGHAQFGPVLAEKLGIPHDLIWRHPCPGPGLGVRLRCSTGEELRSGFETIEPGGGPDGLILGFVVGDGWHLDLWLVDRSGEGSRRRSSSSETSLQFNVSRWFLSKSFDVGGDLLALGRELGFVGRHLRGQLFDLFRQCRKLGNKQRSFGSFWIFWRS